MDNNDENVQNGEQNESPEQKANKIQKQYEGIMKVITAVVGGKENLLPKRKLSEDETVDIVAELFAEEGETLRKQTKDGLKDLLKKHVEAESEVSKKRKELDDLQNKKRKEFIDAAKSWLNKIDQAAVQQGKYAEALQVAFKGDEDAKEGKKESGLSEASQA